MKKTILTLLVSVAAMLTTFGQSNMNYQAVLRNDDGTALANSNINAIFEFREDNSSGTVIYSESHSATTNDLGEFNLKLGDGTVVSGNFSDLDFKDHIYFLNTNINGDDMGTTQIESTPVAQVALNAHWDKNTDDDLLYQEGGAIIGSNNKDASRLTVVQENGTTITNNEIVDIRCNEDLTGSKDIINLYTTGTSSDNAQFIECAKGFETKFRVNVSGDIETYGKVTSDNTGNAHMLPYAYGKVSGSGNSVLGTSNYSITRLGSGVYRLSFNTAETPNSTMVISATSTTNRYIAYEATSSQIYFYVRNSSGTATDGEFSFTIYKP